MISRRLLISSAAAVGAAGFSGSLFAAAPDPVLGKDYIEVRPPLEFPKKPIVVHDFFAYTCPHCLTFAPVMEKFIESVKGNPEVKVVPVPVAWNDDLAIFPHTYYAFEALGRMGDLHMEFWDLGDPRLSRLELGSRHRKGCSAVGRRAWPRSEQVPSDAR